MTGKDAMNSAKARLKVSVPFLAALLLGPTGETWASCGADGCPLDLSLNTSPRGTNRSTAPRMSLQLAYETIDQDQLWAGHHRIPPAQILAGQITWPEHEQELTTQSQNLRLMANCELTPRWSVRAAFPVVHRTHSHLVHNDTKVGEVIYHQDELEQWDFTRTGDLTLGSRYKVWSGDTFLTTGLGVSLPTGATAMRNAAGDEAELSLQPGKGSVGVLFELSLQYLQRNLPSFSGRQPARLFASTFYQLHLRGKEDYRFGNECMLQAGGQYPLFSRIGFVGQLVAHWKGRDEEDQSGEVAEATGSTSVYLSPGLQAEISPGLSLYSYYQVPVYHRVHEVQIKPSRNLLMGLGYSIQ